MESTNVIIRQALLEDENKSIEVKAKTKKMTVECLLNKLGYIINGGNSIDGYICGIYKVIVKCICRTYYTYQPEYTLYMGLNADILKYHNNKIIIEVHPNKNYIEDS